MSKTKKPTRVPKYGARVLVGGHFHPNVQTQLRKISDRHNKTIQDLLTEGLDYVFDKYNFPKIAWIMPEPGGSRQ